MNAPPPPRPPEPMAVIWIARKPGARSVDVIVGEAEAERAIADLSAALAAIRAGKRAIAGMTAPRGAHPYPEAGVDAARWGNASDGKPGILCDCGWRLPWPARGEETTCGNCGAVYEHDGVTIGGGARLKALGDLPGASIAGDEADDMGDDPTDAVAEDGALPPCAACGDAEVMHEPRRPGEPIASGPCAGCACTAYALPQEDGDGAPVTGRDVLLSALADGDSIASDEAAAVLAASIASGQPLTVTDDEPCAILEPSDGHSYDWYHGGTCDNCGQRGPVTGDEPLPDCACGHAEMMHERPDGAPIAAGGCYRANCRCMAYALPGDAPGTARPDDPGWPHRLARASMRVAGGAS